MDRAELLQTVAHPAGVGDRGLGLNLHRSRKPTATNIIQAMSMPAAASPCFACGDPDLGRLLVVHRPLPDHLLALGLLSRRARGREDDFGPYALAVASALLFFASILLHELGHAYVAIRPRDRDLRDKPVDVRRGGIPGGGLRLALYRVQDRDRGPIVTALIVLLCAGAGLLLAGTDEFREAALTTGEADTSGLAALIAWLGSISLLVLIFNLVPAFPWTAAG